MGTPAFDQDMGGGFSDLDTPFPRVFSRTFWYGLQWK